MSLVTSPHQGRPCRVSPLKLHTMAAAACGEKQPKDAPNHTAVVLIDLRSPIAHPGAALQLSTALGPLLSEVLCAAFLCVQGQPLGGQACHALHSCVIHQDEAGALQLSRVSCDMRSSKPADFRAASQAVLEQLKVRSMAATRPAADESRVWVAASKKLKGDFCFVLTPTPQRLCDESLAALKDVAPVLHVAQVCQPGREVEAAAGPGLVLQPIYAHTASLQHALSHVARAFVQKVAFAISFEAPQDGAPHLQPLQLDATPAALPTGYPRSGHFKHSSDDAAVQALGTKLIHSSSLSIADLA